MRPQRRRVKENRTRPLTSDENEDTGDERQQAHQDRRQSECDERGEAIEDQPDREYEQTEILLHGEAIVCLLGGLNACRYYQRGPASVVRLQAKVCIRRSMRDAGCGILPGISDQR